MIMKSFTITCSKADVYAQSLGATLLEQEGLWSTRIGHRFPVYIEKLSMGSGEFE
jgi:hypothetical protein